jgi:membrane fusion protein (multidrug efflux system)
MNARMTNPAPGEARVVTLPAAEKSPAEIRPETEGRSTAEAKVEATAAPSAAPEAKPRRPSRRIALMIAVPLVLAVGGGWFWLTGGRYVDTDNAYVQQTMVSISPDISGRIVSVAVHDNQQVKAGDVLFTLDPEPYQIALDQADAALAAARLSVEQLQVGYKSALAKLDAAQSALEIEQRNFDRTQSLAKQGLAAQTALDDATSALQSAQSNVSLAQQSVAGAAAALGGNADTPIDQQPSVRTALAQKATAERNLAHTEIDAPAAGTVSQVGNLNVGQFVAAGSMIATLVETDDTWVEANFKETQLATLHAGQPAEVSVDALPGVSFEGDVQSIGAATGSEFALIPAQNATGNWVKVTQRIPVRIHIAHAGAERLRAGMSANVSVDTGKSTLDQMLGK